MFNYRIDKKAIKNSVLSVLIRFDPRSNAFSGLDALSWINPVYPVHPVEFAFCPRLI
jgi:hypothetical protein